jgi:hypothetical protein
MTYEEYLELGDVLFDEFLAKVPAATRRDFMDSLASELESAGVLELEDGPQADEEDDV